MTLIEFLQRRLGETREYPGFLRTLAAILPEGQALRDMADTIERDIQAKERLVEDLLAEMHLVVEDCWYTCAAATYERDGGTSCRDDDEPGDPCTCGRDKRVERRLRLLALPYADHPDYDERWRP